MKFVTWTILLFILQNFVEVSWNMKHKEKYKWLKRIPIKSNIWSSRFSLLGHQSWENLRLTTELLLFKLKISSFWELRLTNNWIIKKSHKNNKRPSIKFHLGAHLNNTVHMKIFYKAWLQSKINYVYIR